MLLAVACASGQGKGLSEADSGDAVVLPGNVDVSPVEVRFGDLDTVSEGAQNIVQSVVVANRGSGPLSLLAVEGPGGVLSLDGAPVALAPDEETALDAVFAAGTGGTFDADFVVVTDDPTTPRVTVSLQGRAIAPGATASPTMLEFGGVVTGTASELVLKVGNEGFLPLALTDLRVEGAGFSLVQGDVPVDVEVETQRAYVLQFAPDAIGEHTGTAVFSTNDPGFAELRVGLQGTGR